MTVTAETAPPPPAPEPVYEPEPQPAVEVAYVEPASYVYVTPEVQVIEDYDYPVFFSSGLYWRWDNGVWYSSSYHDRGWVTSTNVPVYVRNIQRPETYVHFRANVNARPGQVGYRAQARPVIHHQGPPPRFVEQPGRPVHAAPMPGPRPEPMHEAHPGPMPGPHPEPMHEAHPGPAPMQPVRPLGPPAPVQPQPMHEAHTAPAPQPMHEAHGAATPPPQPMHTAPAPRPAPAHTAPAPAHPAPKKTK